MTMHYCLLFAFSWRERFEFESGKIEQKSGNDSDFNNKNQYGREVMKRK